MYQNYLITGATGFLGSAVVQLLLAHGCRVLALVKDRDPLIYTLPNHVAVFYGDLTDKESLRDFFAAGGDDFCVLHCAGLISIASKPDEALYAVNVQGTQNIVDLCREFGASRLVYVSSVHAIPEKPAPETITEPDRFAPDEILGDYGKSKAMATALVLEAAQSGLNASVVLPSGILGPGDLARGNMTRMLLAFCRGQLPLGVNCEDADAASAVCEKLNEAFDLPVKDGSSSMFASSGIEVMKTMFKGKNGHIAIRTNSVELAVAELAKKGFAYDESSAKYKNGRMTVAYLKDEFGGFAVHLLQK